jgi:azurin
MRTLTVSLALLTLTAGSGCSKSEADQAKPMAAAASAPATPAATSAAPSAPAVVAAPTASAKPAQKVELAIASVANTMTFDKTALSVPAGAEVHLVFKNNATMSTLPHNWVLVKTGTEAAVAAAGLKTGEAAGYVDVRDHDMVAHTPQAKPGETVDITFTAPDTPGAYPYICTTPGHYMMMKGVLTVTP